METLSPTRERANHRWLTLARIGWVALTLILIGLFVAGLPLRFEELKTICEEDCVPMVLTVQEASVLNEYGLSLDFYAVYILVIDILYGSVFLLLASIIFWRKSSDWIGIASAFTFVLFGLNLMVEPDDSLVRVFSGLNRPVEFLTYFGIISFVFLINFFPNGQFAPPWTKYLGPLLVAVVILDPIIRAFTGSVTSASISPIGLILFLVMVVVSVLAQVYRYKYVSDAEEKQQTKWVVVGLAALLFAMVGWTLGVDLNFIPPGSPRLFFNLVIYSGLFLLMLMFPLSIFLSILRYRLWDIDVVINRALVYGFLTGFLALIYIGSVILLQGFSQVVLGESDSPLVIVISTLIIAALFNPFRHWIQNLIDHRFFRRRYDAARTLEAFSANLRNQVELEELTEHLLTIVEETLQPISLDMRMKNLTPESQRREELQE